MGKEGNGPQFYSFIVHTLFPCCEGAAIAITHSDTAARDRGNLSEFAAEGSQGGRHWKQLATLHLKSEKGSECFRASVELSSALHTVQNALSRERPPSQLRQ